VREIIINGGVLAALIHRKMNVAMTIETIDVLLKDIFILHLEACIKEVIWNSYYA